MKIHPLVAAGALLALGCASALAQTPAPADTTVTVHWGDIVANAAQVGIGFAAIVVAWIFRALPASIVQVLRTMQAEQLLTMALQYAFNATAGAVKGQTLTVDVGNGVVANALQYIVDRAPAWLIQWLGGQSAIKQMLIARLDVETSAAVAISAAGGPQLIKR